MKLYLVLLLLVSFVPCASGQKDTLAVKRDTAGEKLYLIPRVNRNGEILPEVEIKEVTVVGPKSTRRSENRAFDRLVYNLKKVYPYALVVRNRLSEVNEELKNIPGERERKKYLRDVEKDVFGEYEDDIRDMTITQGRLLIKLIDRETQNTSYELIRDYRGKFSATFWQGIARIFGTNLKEEYDADGNDLVIELIIGEIEAGRL